MWPLILVALLLGVDPPGPVELGQDPVEVTLIEPDEAEARRRVHSIAADPAQQLVLHLRGIEAEEKPEVSWEIYVASSDTADCDNVPALAGILSLYGVPPNGVLTFPLDMAIIASRPVGLKIIFKPTSGLEVDGEPVPPVVRTSVRIDTVVLETEETFVLGM